MLVNNGSLGYSLDRIEMKRTLLIITLAVTAAVCTARAGTSDKIILKQPLIVATTKDECKNLGQMLQDGDKEGATAEFAEGKLAAINAGETIYVVDVGWDGIVTIRYHGQICYAPNHEVHVIVYGNQ